MCNLVARVLIRMGNFDPKSEKVENPSLYEALREFLYISQVYLAEYLLN
jgi:hypothetical protein